MNFLPAYFIFLLSGFFVFLILYPVSMLSFRLSVYCSSYLSVWASVSLSRSVCVSLCLSYVMLFFVWPASHSQLAGGISFSLSVRLSWSVCRFLGVCYFLGV